MNAASLRSATIPAMTSPWWRSAVVYQVYPRSFADGDGDGIGDLHGIAGRLEHVRDLGADAIWLSPIYRSPMADFGYDISDHTAVDPTFGTLADADTLIARAHDLGLRLLLDFVPNHTSNRHPWFEQSRTGADSARRSWYVWRPGEGPPNNWVSSFGEQRPAWTRDERTGEWYLHSFLPEQPDLNWDEPAVAEAMHDVLRFWLHRDVDGFRIDVAHKIGKDPALGDNEPGLRHDEDWPSVHPRIAAIRRVLEEFDGDRVAIGEVYVLDQRSLAQYVVTGDELHLAHNFFFLNLPWSAIGFRAAVDEFEDLTREGGWPAWCLNNHDHSRTATRYGPDRARVAAILVLTLRGTPFLYQGEELGLTDAHVPAEQIVDVDGRDPARAPMPWAPPSQAGRTAGFGDGEPWLPVHQDAERLAVAAQAGDPGSTLELYRALIALRRAEPALREGTYRSLDAAPDVFAFVREHDGRRLLVALNFSPFPRPLPAHAVGGRLLLSTHREPSGAELRPDEGRVVEIAGS
jgi:alpha-glucosidase